MIPVNARDLVADAPDLAPWLLNKVLAVDDSMIRIVEVEAYGGTDDDASHARCGPTRRNRRMFETGGHLYVYLIYGLHYCANVVSGTAGDGQAVLIRAGEPIGGIGDMERRRPRPDRRELCNGPAKLTQALGIGASDDGTRLWDADSRIRVCADGMPPPSRPATGPRIGISRAIDRPWRFWVPESPWVSTR